ncbi:MAG: four helix bundle protein [Bacteroidota bacterium]|nr:four helix bundle protein [Bacteroidota bacterium]
MNKEELKNRTKAFALRVIELVDSLPKTQVGKVIGNQLLRSGTSVGANYRSALRARSQADFEYKLGLVEEEADESFYWMELIVDSNLMAMDKVENIMQEANELVAIFASAIITLKKRKRMLNPKS